MYAWQAIGVSISMTLWAFLGLEVSIANANAVETHKEKHYANRNYPIGYFRRSGSYIVSTSVIAGIVPNLELANSTAVHLVYAITPKFNETIGKVIMEASTGCSFASVHAIRLAVHYCSVLLNLQRKKAISRHS